MENLDVRSKLIAETAKIPWRELQRFFAGGKALYVIPDVDLIEVGCEITADNTATVNAWMETGQLGPVSDEQAREWFEANAVVWATVVRPWVLVQPVLEGLNEGYRDYQGDQENNE